VQQSNAQQPVSAPKKVTTAFVLSLVGGVLVLLEGLIRIIRGEALAVFGTDRLWHRLLGLAIRVDGVIGVVLAVIIIVGVILIYNSKTRMTGGIIVIVFALLSIIAGGGWLIGLILGVIGGILALLKNNLKEAKLCLEIEKTFSVE
jgi:hypothetical protein